MNNKVILGITAHADDHIMFAGTVMKLQDAGYEYHELVLTDSALGGDHKSKTKEKSSEIKKTRKKEFIEAHKILKTKKVYYLNEKDQHLTYTAPTMHKVLEIIRKVKPEIGISMNSIDVHPDHIATSHIAKEAFRWASKNYKHSLGQPHRTQLVFFSEGTTPIAPHFLVDITKYYSKKEQLFKAYASQASPKDLALMKSFAVIRGYHLRTPKGEFAEAFVTEQNILPVLFE